MLSWGIPLCLAFVATPIIVRGIGTEQYGIYAVILGFLSYAFSSGIGKVAGKYVPEFRASGETEKLSEAVSAAFWLTLAVGVLQAVILTVTAPYIVNDILLIPAANADIVLKALYLAAFSGLVLMVSQVFQFSLQGLHRFDLFAVITNVGAILSAAGNIWLVLAGYGVLPLIAWNAIVAVVTGVIFFAAVKPLLPEWRLSFSIGREMLRLGTALLGKHYCLSGIDERAFALRTLVDRQKIRCRGAVVLRVADDVGGVHARASGEFFAGAVSGCE